MNGQIHNMSEARWAKRNMTDYTDGWQKVSGMCPTLPLQTQSGDGLFSDLDASGGWLTHAQCSQLQGQSFTALLHALSSEEEKRWNPAWRVCEENIFSLYSIQCLHLSTANLITMTTSSLVEQAACCHRYIPVFPWRWGTGRLCMRLCTLTAMEFCVWESECEKERRA